MPTRWQRTAKDALSRIALSAIRSAVSVIAFRSEVVCLACERLDMPNTRVSACAICVGVCVFM